jgi:hypothetical protein
MKRTESRKPGQQKKVATEPASRAANPQPQHNPWQATFTKRLPHRIGQPLSSSGGGDGCA